MGVQVNVGSRIQFRFEKCSNLRRKNGGIPNAAVYAQYTTKAGKKIKSLATAYRKGKPDPEWCENSDTMVGISNDVEFTFIVLDASAPLMRPAKLARSKPYTLGDLFQMRKKAEASTKGVSDGASSTSFAVPLFPISGDSEQVGPVDASGATLTLCLRDWMSDKERREFFDQVEVDWKSKHRCSLIQERELLMKELKQLSTDLSATGNIKALVDMCSGLFESISLLLDNEDIFNKSPHLVLGLITSYRAALSQIRFVTTEQSVDISIQYYGKVCLELAQSIRVLERCLRKPEIRKDDLIIAEISNTTRRFEAYPLGTTNPLGSPDSVFTEREVLRSELINDSPLLLSSLNPAFSVEPTRFSRSTSSLPLPTLQYLSAWALLSSRAELKRLLWLSGPASCGKTQLSTSLIDVFGRTGVSTAYFTFNNHAEPHEDDDINGDPPSLECMTKTLAFQLAAYVPGLSSSVRNAVDGAGKGFDALSFSELFERLVVGPLKTHSGSRKLGVTVKSGGDTKPAHAVMTVPEPVVIILDDVDQCSPRQLDELLGVLVEALPRLPKEARVMMFSRELGAVRGALERCAMASIVGFGEDVDLKAGSSSSGVASARRRDSVNAGTTLGVASPLPGTPGTARSPLRWAESVADPKGKRRSDGAPGSARA